MTEQKKDYMIDALGELEDRYIEEAVNYVKGRFTWKYGKELGALAACAAVVFLSVSAYYILPFKDAADNATGAPENMETVKAEQIIEGMPVEGVMPETAPENSAMSGKLESNTGDSQEKVTEDVVTEESIREYASKGIQWEIVENEHVQQGSVVDKEVGKEVDNIFQNIGGEDKGSQAIQELQTTSCTVWLSAEELLQKDTDIFMGTVTDMQVYHVTGGMDKYCTVATVEVEDNIRGELKVGETYRIYLPFARIDGSLTMTTSINGDLDKLDVGSRAIFMPYKATMEAGLGNDNVWLSYADLAEYYFSEGMRFLFLETEYGVSYAKDVYEVESKGKESLEDVAKYIRKMLR